MSAWEEDGARLGYDVMLVEMQIAERIPTAWARALFPDIAQPLCCNGAPDTAQCERCGHLYCTFCSQAQAFEKFCGPECEGRSK